MVSDAIELTIIAIFTSSLGLGRTTLVLVASHPASKEFELPTARSALLSHLMRWTGSYRPVALTVCLTECSSSLEAKLVA